MGQNQSGSGAEKDQKLLFSPESQDKLKEVFLDASIGDEKVCLIKGLQVIIISKPRICSSFTHMFPQTFAYADLT